jgi:hypothetical protein
MAIVDPDNPYRYLEIRGRVVEITSRALMLTLTSWPRNI